jgi:hypothetical protein
MSEAELRRKELDSFNDHQKDNRNRATQLANYAFLLAGGSFTASITVFSSRPKEQITASIVHFLHIGWYNLFLSMVAFFVLVLVMIFRDYFVAEVKWRPMLDGKEPYLKGQKFICTYVIFELVLIAAGIFGSATLCYGLYKTMQAAFKLVS